MNKDKWIPETLQFCNGLVTDFNQISDQRKAELEEVSTYIRKRKNEKQSIRFTVICTHNSRRSHFGQIWLKVAADYYDIEIETYSGGTEATIFHPNAVDAIERCGFQVSPTGDKSNPVYSIFYSENSDPILCYSKRFDSPDNPSEGFGAILVCSDAAEACPHVPGAERRFVLPYRDPKEFDGTDIETQKYDERCRQIARELFYAVSRCEQVLL